MSKRIIDPNRGIYPATERILKKAQAKRPGHEPKFQLLGYEAADLGATLEKAFDTIIQRYSLKVDIGQICRVFALNTLLLLDRKEITVQNAVSTLMNAETASRSLEIDPVPFTESFLLTFVPREYIRLIREQL